MPIPSSPKPSAAGAAPAAARTARKTNRDAGSTRRLLSKALHTAKLLVVGHVRLKRRGKDIVVVLEERGAQSAAAPAGKEADVKGGGLESAMLFAMQSELADVLDYHAGTRTTLRHLAIFEKKFKQHGVAALHALPVPLLQRALHQLDTLCADLATPAVVDLRSRMEIAIMERETLQSGPPTVNGLSTFNTADKLQVAEVPVSDFLRARQELGEIQGAEESVKAA